MFTPGRITDIDARRKLTPAEVARIEASMDAHAVTVLSGQDITDEQQLAFSRNFGPLEEGANSGARDSELREHGGHVEVLPHRARLAIRREADDLHRAYLDLLAGGRHGA